LSAGLPAAPLAPPVSGGWLWRPKSSSSIAENLVRRGLRMIIFLERLPLLRRWLEPEMAEPVARHTELPREREI